jgi:hypothetical protein
MAVTDLETFKSPFPVARVDSEDLIERPQLGGAEEQQELV